MQREFVSGAGLGLRRALLEPLGAGDEVRVDFLEVAPENWIGIGGGGGAAPPPAPPPPGGGAAPPPPPPPPRGGAPTAFRPAALEVGRTHATIAPRNRLHPAPP
ncbi:hypothetical protein I5I64_15650 [Pseudomonas aeruginosa]|nr:hypothetical protein [Pseudomonas aeruginosa]